MSLKSQLKERAKKTKEIVELEVVGFDEPLTFRLTSLTLAEVLTKTAHFPSLASVLTGRADVADFDQKDPAETLKQTLEFIDAINAIVALAVEVKDGEEWVSFDTDNSEKGEEALVPKEVLPQQTLIALGTQVIKIFRV